MLAAPLHTPTPHGRHGHVPEAGAGLLTPRSLPDRSSESPPMHVNMSTALPALRPTRRCSQTCPGTARQHIAVGSWVILRYPVFCPAQGWVQLECNGDHNPQAAGIVALSPGPSPGTLRLSISLALTTPCPARPALRSAVLLSPCTLPSVPGLTTCPCGRSCPSALGPSRPRPGAHHGCLSTSSALIRSTP